MLYLPTLAGAAAYVPRGKEPTWTPADFASVTLVGYYDAEDNSKLTDVAGKCSAWVDSANALNILLQAVGASQPAIVASHALTGRQVLQFDGTDDQMTLAPCPYATMGNLSILVVGVQDALPADTTTRYLVSTGQSVTNGLMCQRVVGSSQNRARTATGNGAGGTNNGNSVTPTVLMDNRFIFVGTWASTTQVCMLNGAGPSASNAATMFGDTTRFRLGASAAGTPAGFLSGAISAVIYVTGVISAQDLNNFHIWAARRLGGPPI